MTHAAFPAKITALLFLLPIGLAYSQSWAPLGGGIRGFAEFPSYVTSMVSFNDRLYVVGYFTTAGGITANCIASWDGSRWYPYPPGLSEAGMYSSGYRINSLVFFNTIPFAGGDFDSIGGYEARAIAQNYKSLWTPVASGFTHGMISAMIVYRNELYITGGFDSLAGFFAGGIAKFNGGSWSPVGSGSDYRGGTTMLVYNNELYVGGPHGVMKWDSTNWTDMSAGLGKGRIVSSLAAYGSRLYISTADNYLPNAILVWNDSSWTPIVPSRKNIYYSGLAVYNGRLYAGGSYGSFDSSVGVNPSNGIASWDGSGWISVGAGEIGGIVTLTVHNSELYAGGGFVVAGGDSVFNIAKLSIPTDVDEPPKEGPKTYVLAQNYPNPFNPTTMIEYSLPTSVHVTLTVFDMLGRAVKTLVNDQQNAGVHRISFSSAGLPTGVYAYRIQTPEFVQTKRMLLLK